MHIGGWPAPALRTSALSFALVLVAAAMTARADETELVKGSNSSASSQPGSELRAMENSSNDFSNDIQARKSYAIPAGEIVGFDFLLNEINRHAIGGDYKSNIVSIRHNLQHNWHTDTDPFTVNQLGHPYQGSMYYGFARSAGLDFWESMGYTVAGSAMWEIAGENTPPSLNDQITTGFGGTLLGEALFRMSHLVLDQARLSSFWREVFAAAIAPPTGVNRLAFGERFDRIFASHEPVYDGRITLGVATNTEHRSGTSTIRQHTEEIADFSLDYGLPGKPGYSYDRPFDYFTFKITASSANGFETLMTRGLLFGTDYAAGNNYRGVWGLYGTYDYIEPQIFRVSTTALSLGTTGQWWLSRVIALQGSALLGAGYGAVGTVHGTADNDYHLGVAPQSLVALRAIFGDRVSLDATIRENFVTRLGETGPSGHDNIIRTDAALTVRVHKQHAVAIRYVVSRRDTSTSDIGNIVQRSATVGLFYTYLGGDRFGVVDWREGGAQ